MTDDAAARSLPLGRDTHHASRNTIRHFALHRIENVELRVISDIEEGVIGITEVEEAVLRRFAAVAGWPHQVVSLFVLSDLSPLQRQLVATAKLPPGGVEGLGLRPIVNLYDLADLAACNIFINQTAMAREGYWADRLAETALLAHEHAHPLAENDTTQATRRVSVTVRPICQQPLDSVAEDAWAEKLRRLLQLQVEKLCLYAPREVFTNDLVLREGFGDALYHLDLQNVNAAVRGVQSRPALVASLAAEAALSDTGRAIFLVVADLKAHLDLALEIASFHRMGHVTQARSLDQILSSKVFPVLAPVMGAAYRALIQAYRSLTPAMSPEALTDFARQVVAILAEALRPYGVALEAPIEVKQE
jgi:hypothetical protein